MEGFFPGSSVQRNRDEGPRSTDIIVVIPTRRIGRRHVSAMGEGAAQLSLEPFSSATRQIVAGRIIDTIEGFIFPALGARRGEGSSITVTRSPKKRYPPIYLGSAKEGKKEARSARMPGPIPPRRLEKLDPSAAQPVIAPVRPLSPPLLSPSNSSSPALKILHGRRRRGCLSHSLFLSRRVAGIRCTRVKLVGSREEIEDEGREGKRNFTRGRFGFSAMDRVGLHAGSTSWNREPNRYACACPTR